MVLKSWGAIRFSAGLTAFALIGAICQARPDDQFAVVDEETVCEDAIVFTDSK